MKKELDIIDVQKMARESYNNFLYIWTPLKGIIQDVDFYSSYYTVNELGDKADALKALKNEKEALTQRLNETVKDCENTLAMIETSLNGCHEEGASYVLAYIEGCRRQFKEFKEYYAKNEAEPNA